MSNTARPVATYLATCVREPLAVLRKRNPELGLGLMRQLDTIVEGTRRLDALTRHERLGARMPIYYASADLSAIMQAGRAIGHVAASDLQNTLEAIVMLTEALRHDRQAEAHKAGEPAPRPEPEPAQEQEPEQEPKPASVPLPASEPEPRPEMEPPF